VTTLDVVTPRGRFAVAGADVRRLLGLRSTWFTVGVLALKAPAGPVVYGSSVQLEGTARAVGKVDVQQRVAGGAWQTLTQAVPKAGVVSVVAKPTASTQYRLAVKNAAAGAVRVAVAPLVRITEPQPTLLRGFVRPARAGASVQIQRLAGTTWTQVAKAPLGSDGKFEARLQLSDGMYRARIAPTRGFVAGTSPPLKVVTG
jgi:hypothetical protein